MTLQVSSVKKICEQKLESSFIKSLSEVAKRIVFYYQMSSTYQIVNAKLTITIKSIIYHVVKHRSRPT